LRKLTGQAVHGPLQLAAICPTEQAAISPISLPESYSDEEIDQLMSIKILRENLSRHRLNLARIPSSVYEFEDHWARLCEMDWKISQELPVNIKRRLREEWENYELDPVRYGQVS
jgi:hypothetical protein